MSPTNNSDNKVKVIANNGVNRRKDTVTNDEYKIMRKWMQNEYNSNPKNMEYMLQTQYYYFSWLSVTKYAYMEVEKVKDLPKSFQELNRHDKGEATSFRLFVFEASKIDEMEDAYYMEFFCCNPNDTVIMKIYKIQGQEIRMYKDPKKSITNTLKNFFTGLVGGKVKKRRSRRINEGDVIVSKGAIPRYVESEKVKSNAKVGIMYLIKENY